MSGFVELDRDRGVLEYWSTLFGPYILEGRRREVHLQKMRGKAKEWTRVVIRQRA